MPIQSIAAPSEVHSPFYLANQAICEAWEAFAKAKNGSIRAKYNAWALVLEAQLPNYWTIRIEKSTTTNAGFFFPSNKNAFQSTTVRLSAPCLHTHDFKIRHVGRWDRISMDFRSDMVRLNQEYLLQSSTLPINTDLLDVLINSDSMFNTATYKAGKRELQLQFQNAITDFELIQRLLNYNHHD